MDYVRIAKVSSENAHLSDNCCQYAQPKEEIYRSNHFSHSELTEGINKTCLENYGDVRCACCRENEGRENPQYSLVHHATVTNIPLSSPLLPLKCFEVHVPQGFVASGWLLAWVFLPVIPRWSLASFARL